MFWITLKRIVSSGWINFRRSGFVSTSAVLITTITLSVITALIIFQGMLFGAVKTLQNKVDVTVFFNVGSSEEDIFALKQQLEKLPEVDSVTYTSADEEVIEFRERHSNDYLTLQALEELGDNPFGGSFRIKAKDSSQYESIAALLEGDTALAKDNALLIERINFAQNKQAIDRLNSVISAVEKGGLATSLIFAIVSITIMYTTIRLTIYMVKDEIGIMRLVGASRMYARGPFVVEGVIYGILAWAISSLLFFPVTIWVNAGIGELIDFNVYQYFTSHLLIILPITLGIALVLSFISSWLAVRKYLNV